MKAIDNTYLIGTYEDQIVTMEVNVTDRNGYDEFTASFNVGQMVNVDQTEEQQHDYFCSVWDDCYSAENKLELLEDGDITKEEVIERWMRESTYRDIIDCSCTDLEINYNGWNYNFETTSYGQCDYREDILLEDMELTNKEIVDYLMNLWDNNHLKEISREEQQVLFDKLKSFEDFEWHSEKCTKYITNKMIDYIER